MTQPTVGSNVSEEARARGAMANQALATRPPSGDGGSVVARSSPVKKVAVYAALLVFALIYIYPFIVQLSTAFKTNGDAVANPLTIVPDPITTAAFERIAQTDFPRWFMNSVIVTVFVTLGRVFLDSLAGYSLARLKYRGRDAGFTAVLAVMAVPGMR